MFKHAIVRQLPDSYPSCVSTHSFHHSLNITLAKEQRKKYIKVLQELGLEVIILPSLETFPDCCFVEDTAILYKSKAIITRMGAPSRRGESDTIEDILGQYFKLSKITEPGTIEGGDVLHIPNRLVSGLSQRTNEQGIKQASDFFQVPIDTIVDPAIIHLKSYISYLDDQTILVSQTYAEEGCLSEFEKIIVPQDEIYAANVLSINDTIIIPDKFPKTEQLLREKDFDISIFDTTEFAKCNGALTCLSLLF